MTELPERTQIRKMINDVFQDGDPNAEIGTDIANAICEQHTTKFVELLDKSYQSGVEDELKRIDSKIGFLRQWLNERSKTYLVSNDDIRHWLDISNLTNQGETK